jgi:SAM-dependent methyltransferase
LKKRNGRIIQNKSNQDRSLDKQRYDQAAQLEINKWKLSEKIFVPEVEIPEQFREPFGDYYEAIYELIPADSKTLELGSGSGRHTAPLFYKSKQVYACDISGPSLKLMQIRFGTEERKKLVLIESSMDDIPIAKESFDVIVSCGSWSYADQTMLITEIDRVLRPGGMLIVLDSLNHNPIYRLNRYLRFRKGERTLSTIRRMPTFHTFEALSNCFNIESVKFFGSFLWLFPLIRKILGVKFALQVESRLTQLAPKKLAFKFLLVAKKI